MASGVVKWFSKAKGYGIIASDAGARVLLPASALMGGWVKKGQRVSFEVREQPTGPVAHNVMIERAPEGAVVRPRGTQKRPPRPRVIPSPPALDLNGPPRGSVRHSHPEATAGRPVEGLVIVARSEAVASELRRVVAVWVHRRSYDRGNDRVRRWLELDCQHHVSVPLAYKAMPDKIACGACPPKGAPKGPGKQAAAGSEGEGPEPFDWAAWFSESNERYAYGGTYLGDRW